MTQPLAPGALTPAQLAHGGTVPSKFSVLVTGGTGKLGLATCQALARHGYEVRATDQKLPPEFPWSAELGDLKDEFFVHRLVRGVGAVVHLGNHPNAFAGPSPQRLLAENTQMNANVFQACVQLGVQRLVFASSVQAFLYTDFSRMGPPYRMPYLPLDGRAGCAPGPNTYGQSKEFAERMLQHLCAAHPRLAATSLRFPMLVGPQLIARFESLRTFAYGWFDFHECLSHLTFEDAAELIVACVERGDPGYRQHFPALAMQLQGRSSADLIAAFYPDTELRQAREEITDLIDLSELTRDTGWRPQRRICVPLED
jgi:nucleoside-diphosphate-sugar epimerase